MYHVSPSSIGKMQTRLSDIIKGYALMLKNMNRYQREHLESRLFVANPNLYHEVLDYAKRVYS